MGPIVLTDAQLDYVAARVAEQLREVLPPVDPAPAPAPVPTPTPAPPKPGPLANVDWPTVVKFLVAAVLIPVLTYYGWNVPSQVTTALTNVQTAADQSGQARDAAQAAQATAAQATEQGRENAVQIDRTGQKVAALHADVKEVQKAAAGPRPFLPPPPKGDE